MADVEPTDRELETLKVLWKRGETRSQLRQRIAVSLDERLTILRNCSRTWRALSLSLCVFMAFALSLLTIEPGQAVAEELSPPSKKVTTLDSEPDVTQAEGPATFAHLKSFQLRVVDPDGNPIEGVKVRPWGLRSNMGHGRWRTPNDNPKEAPTVVTDPDGLVGVPYPESMFAHLESRITEVSCQVSRPNFAVTSMNHILVPEAGVASITMQRGGVVRVAGTLNGHRIEPKELHVRSSKRSLDWVTSVDDDGLIVLPRLPAGIERIRLVHKSKDGPVCFSRVVELHIENDHEYELIEPLHAGVELVGKLSDDVPRPITSGYVDATVLATRREFEVDNEYLYWNAWAPIAADGTFRLTNLPPGEQVQMIALSDGYVSREGEPPAFAHQNDRMHPRNHARPQVFPLHKATNEAVLDMVQGAIVEIEVVDQQGTAVEGVRVGMSPNVCWWNGGSQIYGEPQHNSAEYLDRPWSREALRENRFSAMTNEDGIARIEGLPRYRDRERFHLAPSTSPYRTTGTSEGYNLDLHEGKVSRKRVVIDRPAELPVGGTLPDR